MYLMYEETLAQSLDVAKQLYCRIQISGLGTILVWKPNPQHGKDDRPLLIYACPTKFMGKASGKVSAPAILAATH